MLQLCFSEHEFGTNDVLQLFDAPSNTASGEVDGVDGSPSRRQQGGASTSAEPTAALDFDPAQFITDKIDQGIALDVVCKDLSTFERFLQNRILQHVHEDVYEAFVSVSGELVGVDEQLTRVYQPLIGSKTRLESALLQLSNAETSVLGMLRIAEVQELHRQFHVGCTQALVLYDALCDATDELEKRAYFRSLSLGSSSSGTTNDPTKQQTNNTTLVPDDADMNALRHILSDLLDFENCLRNISVPAVAGLPHSASPPTSSNAKQTQPSSQQTTPEQQQQLAKKQQAELQELKDLARDAHQHIMTILNNTFIAVHSVYVSVKLGGTSSGSLSSDDNNAQRVVGGAFQHRLLVVLTSLTQAYATVGVDEFVALYRDHIVRGFVESLLSWKAAAAARTSPDHGAALLSELCVSLGNVLFPLVSMIRQVLGAATATTTASTVASATSVDSLQEEANSSGGSPLSPSSPGNHHSDTSSSRSPHRHLMSLVYWPAICNTVVTRMVFLFLPGIAATFHKHFIAAHQLVLLLEAQCGSMSELQGLRSSPEMTLWAHKWNVDVYHTLRATEAKDLLNHATQIIAKYAQQTPSSTSPPPFTVATLQSLEYKPHSGGGQSYPAAALQATSEVAHAALWLFSDGVFLFPLSHKLLRDAAIAVRDYVSIATQAAISQMKNIESSTAPAAAGGGAGSNTAAAAGGGGDGTIAFIGHVLKDLDWLGSQFVPVLLKAAVERATCEDAATCPPLANILLRCREMIQKQGVTKVQQALASSLTSQCSAVLQNIPTIKSTYSHTKKPMPSAPSWFISGILDALQKFKTGAKNGLPDALVQQICATVIDDVTAKFRELAKDTIISARRIEENLGKLKLQRQKREAAQSSNADLSAVAPAAAAAAALGGQRPSADGASDRDKMVMQLYLDAHEYGSLLRPFGVHKERYAPLQSILKLCRRAEWLLGDDNAPEPQEVADDE